MSTQQDALAQMVARVAEEQPIIEALERDGMNPIMAHIIANDIVSAKRATEMVERGEATAEKASIYVGSYARWDWVLTMHAAGRISREWLAENVCHLWQGSDPDDTNPDYLSLWKALKAENGGYLRDGRPLPRGGQNGLRVYRGGQAAEVAKGFAWTTDPKIAMKFAVGVRVPMPGGVVISGDVDRGDVIAFITGRRESEVIVDPRHVSGGRIVKTSAQVAAHWIAVRGPE